MPEPARPNPSLFVLDIPRAADRARIAERLIRDAPGEDGNPLAPLGGNRYVVSRAVAKKLARAHPALLDWLGRLDGVALARRMRADQGVALYGALDPADPTHRAPASPWHYKEIRLTAARRHLQRQNPGGLARVRVAQIDTGFTEHPCFGSWRGGQNPHIRADLGLNFLESGAPPRDPFEDQYPEFPGHGSRIASIIAANNPGQMQGVAPGVSLVPYRVTNTVVINFFGNVTRLGEAIDHAWRHNGCQVINISMGDPCAPGEEHGATLQAPPEPLRSQMLKGDWQAGIQDDPWQVIPTNWVRAAQERWKQGGRPATPMDAVGVDVAQGGDDETLLTPRHGNWIGEQVIRAGRETPDGPAATGGCFWRRFYGLPGREARGVTCRRGSASGTRCSSAFVIG